MYMYMSVVACTCVSVHCVVHMHVIKSFACVALVPFLVINEGVLLVHICLRCMYIILY